MWRTRDYMERLDGSRFLRKKEGQRIFYLLLFCLLMSIVLTINFKTPLIGEDYALSLPYSLSNKSLIEKIPSINSKISKQFLTWNSRIGEQLAIIFLAIDKTIFNFVNTGFFLVFCWLIIIYSTGTLINEYLIKKLLLAVSIVFLTFPEIGQVFFWLTGSTNYLWGIVLILLFLLPYRMFLAGYDLLHSKNILIKTMYLLLGLLAGMTNENTVPAMIFILICSIVWFHFKKKRIPRWYWSGVISFIAGFLVLFLSPSTLIRYSYYKNSRDIPDPSISMLVANIKKIVQVFFESNWPLILICIILFISFYLVFLLSESRKKINHRNIIPIIIFSAGSLISLAPLVFAPYIEERSFLITWFFFAVIIFWFIIELERYYKKIETIAYLAAVITIVLLINIVNIYDRFEQEVNIRHYYILANSQIGVKNLSVDAYQTHDSKYLTTRDNYLENSLHDEVYYGIKSIEIQKKN